MLAPPRTCFATATLVAVALCVPPAAHAQNYSMLFNPENGSYYQLVQAPFDEEAQDFTITWADARAAAAALTHAGFRGHLATITSQAEQDFLDLSLPNDNGDAAFHWVGGYQDTSAPDYSEPGGGWRWITGETWGYENWDPSEPSDSSDEHYLVLWFNQQWNDEAAEMARGGYLVEYSAAGVPGPPAFVVLGLGLAGLLSRRRKSAC